MPKTTKFLFDENIGKTVADYFVSRGYDISTIVETLQGASDKKVLEFSIKEDRILVTLDKDFAELVHRDKFYHCGIILFRLNNSTPQNLILFFEKIIDKVGDLPAKKFIVITETRIRIK